MQRATPTAGRAWGGQEPCGRGCIDVPEHPRRCWRLASHSPLGHRDGSVTRRLATSLCNRQLVRRRWHRAKCNERMWLNVCWTEIEVFLITVTKAPARRRTPVSRVGTHGPGGPQSRTLHSPYSPAQCRPTCGM